MCEQRSYKWRLSIWVGAAGPTPGALKCSPEEPPLFACRAHVLTELSSNRLNTEVCDTIKIKRSGEGFNHLKKFYITHLGEINCLLTFQGAAHFIPKQHTQIHVPRSASMLFSRAIKFSIHECWVNPNFLRSYLPVPCCCVTSTKLHALYESTVLSFSVRNSYCWTRETFMKDMTADLLQRAAEFL